jgi:small subunit ribosomal protein S19e
MALKTSIVYSTEANEYNTKLANALKEFSEFQAPEWMAYVKTGIAKKRPPVDEDFWYKRAASIMRQAYVRGVVGVNRLKTRYGSKKNRGMQPEIFRKGSGKIVRVILQQAEAAGLIEKTGDDAKKVGRKLTEKGKELMEGLK